jgi:hypothetical protein
MVYQEVVSGRAWGGKEGKEVEAGCVCYGSGYQEGSSAGFWGLWEAVQNMLLNLASEPRGGCGIDPLGPLIMAESSRVSIRPSIFQG